MPRFFVEDLSADTVYITGEDANHIGRALRCRPGERLTLCDGKGLESVSTIRRITGDMVELSVGERVPCCAEPPVRVTLFQALPKGDKMEMIVQKAVELGVYEIVPVLTRYCVTRPDENAMTKRLFRLQRIALEAAKQSGRGMIPKILPMISFREAIAQMQQDETAILFYEQAQNPLGKILSDRPGSISIMIGSEGGFAQEEAAQAAQAGLAVCTMGPRILRCETAPCYALSAIMYTYENSAEEV